MIALVASIALAQAWQVDATALYENLGSAPVSGHGAALCVGQADQVLGLAAVIYGRRPGMSAWGHAALRIVACEDGAISDLEYEYYRFGKSSQSWMRQSWPHRPVTWDRQRQRDFNGQLFLYRNEATVDGGHYGREMRTREVFEVWLDLPAEQMRRIQDDMQTRWNEQELVLQSDSPVSVARVEADAAPASLGEDYRALSRNCMSQLQDHLGAGPFPHAFLRALVKQGGNRALVVYPSHHTLARWTRQLGEDGTAALLSGGEPIPLLRPFLRTRHMESQVLERLEASVLRGMTPVAIAHLERAQQGRGVADGDGVEEPAP